MIASYLSAEQELGRIASTVDVGTLAPMLIGTGHLLFAAEKAPRQRLAPSTKPGIGEWTDPWGVSLRRTQCWRDEPTGTCFPWSGGHFSRRARGSRRPARSPARS